MFSDMAALGKFGPKEKKKEKAVQKRPWVFVWSPCNSVQIQRAGQDDSSITAPTSKSWHTVLCSIAASGAPAQAQAPCSFCMFTVREQSQPGPEEVREHRYSRHPAVLASDPKPQHVWGRLVPYAALKFPHYRLLTWLWRDIPLRYPLNIKATPQTPWPMPH